MAHYCIIIMRIIIFIVQEESFPPIKILLNSTHTLLSSQQLQTAEQYHWVFSHVSALMKVQLYCVAVAATATCLHVIPTADNNNYHAIDKRANH